MINDMDTICKKCGGILQRKSLLQHTSNAREYVCKCNQCGDETILSYESTVLDFDDQIDKSDS